MSLQRIEGDAVRLAGAERWGVEAVGGFLEREPSHRGCGLYFQRGRVGLMSSFVFITT